MTGPDDITPTGDRAVSDWWATGISDIAPGVIRLRGYPVEELIGGVGFAQTIWLMLRGELPAPGQAELLELTLVAAVDHGPQAPSIAAARMASSCGLDLNNAMATGINLLGDVHGGAGQQCMEVYAALRARVSDGASPAEAAAELVAEYRSRKAFVPGFGHRFHPQDPRRDPLIGALERAVSAGVVPGDHLAVVLALEAALAEGRSKPVPMNVDGATAAIYCELGFAPELGRGLFVLSRSVGILAHAWEQRSEPVRIKGPIPRGYLPSYTGPGPRPVPPARH
jgi:citrate synthase